MTTIKQLQNKLYNLKGEQREKAMKADLKRQIAHLKKQQSQEEFDKKHKILGAIGRMTSSGSKVLLKAGKKAMQPPSPAKKKYMEENQKRLKKLMEMY